VVKIRAGAIIVAPIDEKNPSPASPANTNMTIERNRFAEFHR
jgi:hypothetical protein